MNVAPLEPLIDVVDDDLAVRTAVALLIGTRGWQVRAFASVAGWLERDDSVVPHCLVLSIELNEPDGALLMKCLRADPHVPPMVLLTAEPGSLWAARARAEGACCVLTKPHDMGRLVGQIARILAPT